MPVVEIYQKHHKLNISKVKMGEKFSIPIILGDGLQYAEQVVKGEDFVPYLPEVKTTNHDLD